MRSRVAAVIDLDFFVMLFWPIVVPWYIFKTRGRSGWKLLLPLLLVMFSAPLAAGVLYVAGLS